MNFLAVTFGFAVSLQLVERMAVQMKLRHLDPWSSGRLLDSAYLFVLALGFGASVAGVMEPNLPSTVVMALAVYVTAIRHKGTFNGGSDTISIHVLVAIAIWQFVPEWAAEVRIYVLAFVSLSYFTAGAAKVRSADWRNGSALSRALLFSNASVPNRVTEWVRRNPERTRAWAWLVMVWELAFPVVWLYPGLAWPMLTMGVVFHLLNFYLFGLNRFFWAWVATYPAFL